MNLTQRCKMYRSPTKTGRQTDRQTDDSIMPIADHTACNSTIVLRLKSVNVSPRTLL